MKGEIEMATNEQIEILLEQLKKAPPSECFQDFDINTAGIRAILKFLNETNGKVTAGMISEYMKVSTARVAVLLKKMVSRNLIERENDAEDGRVVIVKLSEHGKQVAEQLKLELNAHIGEMIDRIGMDRMLEFVTISNEIHSVIKSSHSKYDI